ncbi:MAG: mechanosensitive ion channel domain-containing protein [Pseudomonadota bacterium]
MDLFKVIPLVALSLGEVALVSAIVLLINRRIAKSYADQPDQQFRRQSILVATVLIALLTIILILPLPNETRGALLSLFGIVLSATIALSSTNLVGNIMAGIMLRSVGSFRLGDYIRVGEYFGRVSEMDLLHLEIQTEERDLTTIPNTYVAANPVRVMRTSGSILSVELSLGYDVSRHEIEKLLLEAASRCDLESPFVQIRALGDFSITYAIAGLLTDVKSLLSQRRALRAATIDVLHEAGVEIASPLLVNTREFSSRHGFVPPAVEPIANNEVNSDELVFDKALKAEDLDKLRARREELSAQLAKAADANEPNTTRIERLEQWLARLDERIAEKESTIRGDK